MESDAAERPSSGVAAGAPQLAATPEPAGLSFGAVATILYATVGRSGRRQAGWRPRLLQAVHTQYAVTVGLVPLTMLLFAQGTVAVVRRHRGVEPDDEADLL